MPSNQLPYCSSLWHGLLPWHSKQLYFSMRNVYDQGRISGLKKVGKMARVPYMCHELSLNNQKRTKQSQKQMRVQLGEIRSYSQLFQTTNNKHKTPLVGLITQRSEVQILPPQPSRKPKCCKALRCFVLSADSHGNCPKWHKKRHIWAGISLHSQSHEAL